MSLPASFDKGSKQRQFSTCGGADGILRHQSFILELKNLSEKVGDYFVSDRLPEHQKLWTS